MKIATAEPRRSFDQWLGDHHDALAATPSLAERMPAGGRPVPSRRAPGCGDTPSAIDVAARAFVERGVR